MPATSKKVTTARAAKRMDALAEGIRKVRAANAAKAAKVAAKAKPAAKGRKGPKLLADMLNKPFRDAAARKAAKAKAGKAMPVATLAQIDKAQGVKRDTAEAKGVGSVSGSKATIIHMIETTKGGVSAAEIAKALGWPRAGGTISRAINLATFKVAKVRDADGVLRYSRA